MVGVFLLAFVAAYLATACLGIFVAHRRWLGATCYGIGATLGACALTVSALCLAAPPFECVLPFGIAAIAMHLRIDALSAVFLCIVNFGGFAASLYAIGYGRHEATPARVLPFFFAFLAGMNLVLVANDAFSFLLSWEFMSLSSWALVVGSGESPETRRAGLIYIVMAGIGTMLLLMAFALLAGPEGDLTFAAMRTHAAGWSGAPWVLLLALFGAGSKAGLFPLHAWLPLAHPAAPSHVSALMSGVMTKVAVYAFVRIAFDLLGPVDWRLGGLTMALGAATALMGVIYALMQNDLKRLLAYSTVENIGIIFAALGLSLCFRANANMAAAALAATAALFHACNHALFKSLLFFAAGAIQTATGTRDINRYGGLIRAMPKTALAFLIGSAALCALPPLNGFVSEWMVFQAIFQSPALPQWGLRLLAPGVGAVLALAAALAAACFVKAFGISFLGRARSLEAQTAKEVDPASLGGMALLAGGCIAAGVVPFWVLGPLAGAVQIITGTHLPTHATVWQPVMTGLRNGYSGLAVLAALLAAVATSVLFQWLFANRTTKSVDIWDCGYPENNPYTQYSAASFAQPIRRVFATALLGAHEDHLMPPPGDTAPARIRVRMHDPAWDTLYAPLIKTVDRLANLVNPLQYQTIRRYLAVMFATLVFLLTVLAIWF